MTWEWRVEATELAQAEALRTVWPDGADWVPEVHTVRTWIEPHPGRPPERLRFAVSRKRRIIWATYIPRPGVKRRMEHAAEELED